MVLDGFVADKGGCCGASPKTPGNGSGTFWAARHSTRSHAERDVGATCSLHARLVWEAAGGDQPRVGEQRHAADGDEAAPEAGHEFIFALWSHVVCAAAEGVFWKLIRKNSKKLPI